MPRFVVIALVCGFCLSAPAQDSKENADFKLAVSLYNDKLYDLALEQFRQFTSTYPNTQQGIEARFYLGLTQSKLRMFEEARFTFQNFALAFPDHPKAPEGWWNSAEAYAEMGNMGEAALAFERVKTFHPKSTLAPSALLKAGEYFDRAGEREKSRRALRTLVQEYASADLIHEARVRLAGIYYADGQYELAVAEAKKAADAAPNSPLAPTALQLTAQSLARLGRIEEAKALLTDVIGKYRSGITSHEARLELGRLQRESGQVEEAIKTWSAILEPASTLPPAIREAALLETADALVLRESLEKSIPLYEQAAGIQGQRAGEAFYKASRAAERLGNRQKAGEFALKALKADSGDTYHRAILLGAFRGAVFLKQYQAAVATSQQFQEEYPSDPLIPRLLLETASAYSDHLRDFRHAILLLEKILAEYGESDVADDAAFDLAQKLRDAGSPREALSALESLRKRFPASDYINQAEKELLEIRTFELKNKDGGLENMALLTGDVIAGKPRADLAFRLAEIYFNDLKDYENAARQYLEALEAGLDQEQRPEAWLKRGKALEYAGMTDTSVGREATMLAVAAYDSAGANTPSSKTREEIFAARTRLLLRTATGVPQLRSISATLRDQSSGGLRTSLLVELGVRYMDFRSYSDARVVFEEVLRSRGDEMLEARALYGLAIARIEMGENDSGAVALGSFLDKFPTHTFGAQATARLAGFEASLGRTNSVLDLCQSLEQQFPYARAARDVNRIRADAFYAANQIEEAFKYYRILYEDLETDLFDPKVPPVDLVMRMADCARRIGKYPEAARFYSLALARDTASAAQAEIYFALGGIAREQGNLELAAHYLQQASRFGSATPERQFQAALESADLLFRSEDYASAVSRYAELLPRVKEEGVRRSIQSKMVVCYFRLDNPAEAEKRANAFVRAFPAARVEAAEFEFERGRYHVRKDEIDLAIRRFENVRGRYPQSPVVPETVYWLARALESKNQPQQAIQLYDSLLKAFPAHPVGPRVRLSLGNVYYNLEQWDAAAAHYKAVIESSNVPRDLVQYAASNLIMAYKEIGLFDAALQLTREYIDRYPGDPDLVLKHIDIGVLYQKLGYYDQSILHLQKMLENADPELEAELRYYVGEAFFYKGEYQQAILEFLKVPYLVTKRTKIDWVATSYYMAGQAYEKMSKFDQAITMYNQIIARPGIDPTFKTAARKEIDRVNVLVKTNGKQ